MQCTRASFLGSRSRLLQDDREQHRGTGARACVDVTPRAQCSTESVPLTSRRTTISRGRVASPPPSASRLYIAREQKSRGSRCCCWIFWSTGSRENGNFPLLFSRREGSMDREIDVYYAEEYLGHVRPVFTHRRCIQARLFDNSFCKRSKESNGRTLQFLFPSRRSSTFALDCALFAPVLFIILYRK